MSEIKELVKTMYSLEDEKQLHKLLHEILTPAEINDLALRWKLMKMLKEGIPQRKIASDLGISLCKITRGSKILKEPDSIVNKIISDKTK